MNTSEKNVGLGIGAGISTGLFWGFPFLVPQLCSGFSAIEIAFGRFFFFGLISLFFVKKVLKIITALNLRDRLQLLLLSAGGFWLYSTVLFASVQATDGVVSSMVIGLLPISIPLFTRDRQTGGLRFYGGLAILLFGLLNLFLWPLFLEAQTLKAPSIAGIFGLLASLAMWTWFAIANSKFLHRHPEINRKDFSSVIGVISLVSILPVFLINSSLPELITREGFSTYLVWSLVLGFGSSWLANWLWNVCSYHCRPEVSGPLIISETVFGLLYSFAYEARSPHFYEGLSIGLFMIGVFFAVTAKKRATH
jgi:drug/metabolite transporter (DMT)-like permease